MNRHDKGESHGSGGVLASRRLSKKLDNVSFRVEYTSTLEGYCVSGHGVTNPFVRVFFRKRKDHSEFGVLVSHFDAEPSDDRWNTFEAAEDSLNVGFASEFFVVSMTQELNIVFSREFCQFLRQFTNRIEAKLIRCGLHARRPMIQLAELREIQIGCSSRANITWQRSSGYFEKSISNSSNFCFSREVLP